MKRIFLITAFSFLAATIHANKEVIRFLKIVTKSDRVPVLVHCQHGADRTGTMSALYRIVVQDRTKEEAIQEMQEGGFGFHKIWKNLKNDHRHIYVTVPLDFSILTSSCEFGIH